MASKQEYLNMMKRMDRMGEEKIPTPMNMGMESMRNLDSMGEENVPARKNMGIDSMMREIQSGKGSMSNAELDAIKNSAMAGMSAGMTGNMFDEMKKLDPKSAVREGEIPMSIEIDGKIMMMTPSEIAKMSEVDRNKMRLMSEDMLADLSMADREAVEGLTTMGVSLTDAIKAVMGVSESPASMTEGALGSLPKEKRVIREQEIDPMRGDTTQSLDMQDSINT